VKYVRFKLREKDWGSYRWPEWWNKRRRSDRPRSGWVGNGGTGTI